jgi:hypothetical protein
VFLGRAHYRHRLHVPLEEHLLVMAPPRTYKTAFLADAILRPAIYLPLVPGRGLPGPGHRDPPRGRVRVRSEAHKTAATVRMVMSRALDFMADPDLAASVLPASVLPAPAEASTSPPS